MNSIQSFQIGSVMHPKLVAMYTWLWILSLHLFEWSKYNDSEMWYVWRYDKFNLRYKIGKTLTSSMRGFTLFEKEGVHS